MPLGAAWYGGCSWVGVTAMSALSLASLLPFLLGQADAAAPKAQETPRLEITAGVDAYYGFSAQHPADRASFLPGTGTTAKRADAFSLNLATLGASLEPAPVGFRVLLGVGTAMDVVHAGEPEGVATGLDVWRFVQQASARYATGPLTLEAGIYPSHIGFESFASQANWTYTRGWLGELSPYYQTGLKVGWAFNRRWSAQLHLVNGWQLIGDNNRGKSVGTQVAWSGERLGVSFNTLIGPELPGDSTHLRFFGDTVATLKVTEALQVTLSVDAGLQQRPEVGDALFGGVGAHARYQLSEAVALAARAEVYRDRDGAISGTAQTLAEGTLTLEVRPAEHLVFKLEARHDTSTAEVFTTNTLPGRAQTLLVAGVVAHL